MHCAVSLGIDDYSVELTVHYDVSLGMEVLGAELQIVALLLAGMQECLFSATLWHCTY